MKDLKILVVEDVAVIMKFNQVLIEQMGYHADYATTAEQALLLCRNKQYDLILTDLGLPKMDGMTMAAKIRKYERRYSYKESKIYALTAFDLKNVRQECRCSGINEVFNKPIKPDFLRSIVQECAKSLLPRLPHVSSSL